MKRVSHRIVEYGATICSFFIFLSLAFWGYDLYLARTSPFHGLSEKDQLIDGIRYTFGHKVVLNQYGFRDREIPLQKDPKSYRIMVLGDSFSFGYGLEAEEAYPKVAERILKQKSGRAIEIFNFSRPALTTVEEAKILNELGEVIRPDLVVVGFCFNDPLLPKAYSFIDKGREDFRERYDYLFSIAQGFVVLGFENIGQRIYQAIERWGDSRGLQPTWLTPIERAYDTSSEEWSAFKAALAIIVDYSRKRQLPAPIFAVLNQGASHSEAPDFDHPSPPLAKFMQFWEQAEREASRLGFFTYDHIEEIKKKLPGEYLGINAVDWHPSKNLHKVYGEKLADVILEIFLSEKMLF